MKNKKNSILFTVLALIATIFTGCANTTQSQSSQATSSVSQSSESSAVSELAPASSSQAATQPMEKTTIKIGALKGPTGMGIVSLMDKNDQNLSDNSYEFTISGAPTEIQGKIVSGELDIAAVPTNLAAALYNKTDKGVKIIAVNTLGVLSILSRDESIKTFADLKGTTIYSTGQGSTSEYVLNYLLSKNNLDPAKDVTVEYLAEHTELATSIIAGNSSIALLPQPFVTSVMLKEPQIKAVIDINSEWEKAEPNAKLAMGCLIVRSDFLDNNKDAVDKFLAEYKASTEYVNTNVADAAKLVGKYEIMTEEIAKIAIPKSNIVYIDGEEMQKSLAGFLEVLFKADPKSVGGTLPDDAFYYKK